MYIEYAMKSRQGDRSYNEDYIRVRNVGSTWLAVLADGLGGCGHGELASSTAAGAVMGRFEWDQDRENFVQQAMLTAQNAVLQKQKDMPEAENMSTTLVILRIDGNKAKWCHVGDSRLYWFRKGKLLHQTVDHSVPQMLVNMGEITTGQIRSHPDRNRLIMTIGRPWNDEGYVLSENQQICPGDAFLLCSDGFWEYILEDQMCKLLSKNVHSTEWLREMTKIVEKNGSGQNMDNYSAICLKVFK